MGVHLVGTREVLGRGRGRLGRLGRLRQVNRVVETSDRRVACWGSWKATGIYLAIGLLWGLGVPAERLKRFYGEITD